VAIVPLRANAWAKRRLAHVLGPSSRIELVWRCYHHVLDVLSECGLHVATISPDPLDPLKAVPNPADTVPIPHEVTVQAPSTPTSEVWPDQAPTLNGALDHAVGRAGLPALIVHADLPWLEAADVEQVLKAPGDVVVARARGIRPSSVNWVQS
jgi:2-phospho-L-lactate guanylyltransferase (CobY/MobA/RfbA family)